MIHRARSLVTVLALALPGVASADPTATFLRQDKYTYCDVKILSSLWKSSIADAKVTVGAKLEANSTAYLDGQLRSARDAAVKNPSARCSFNEAGFTYEDAKKLAALWKVGENRAKAIAEDKILGGAEKSLRTMLGKPAWTPPQIAEDPTEVFLKQDRYGGCEVKLLSKLWKTSASDAKARIGTKLLAKDERTLAAELHAARQANHKCTAADAGFSPAEVKHMTRIWEMRAADIDRKVTNGSASTLRAMLADNPPPSGDIAVFVNQTRYTYCDAHMLSKLWSKSVTDAKSFIGAKLAARQRRPIDKAVAQARRHAVKNEDARCPYYSAGLGYEDLVTLAALWKKPEHEMKAEIALRIAKGQETRIKAQLKRANARKPKQPLVQPAPAPAPRPHTKPAIKTPRKAP